MQPDDLPPFDSAYEPGETPFDGPGNERDEPDKALFQEIDLQVQAITILDFAYTLMEVVTRYPNGHKHIQERANSYASQFRIITRHLKEIDERLLKRHNRVRDFYDLNLVKDEDKLWFSEDPLRKFRL